MVGRYELLLGADVMDAVPLSTFTNGYRDLKVGSGPYEVIYKYDGTRYKAIEF